MTKAQALAFLKIALKDDKADFREGQWEAIEALLKNKSRLLVVQRTGWGKSLVYFLATKLLRQQGSGPTLLISPLLALMRNQITAARRLEIQAATINSSNIKDWEKVKTQLLSGQIDLLLISPERLANEEFRETILLPISTKIGLFVVDEAHCISDWGHDFRPDYRRIVRILQALPPTIPVLATTATANNRVIADIKEQLGTSLQIFRGKLARSSLRLNNIFLESPAARYAWLAEKVPKLPGSGIIYALTIKDTERLAQWLISQNINAKAYHSQLETTERESLEEELLNNQIKTLVATTALGMGFDKPDLGFVIHYQRPSSVVHYYQQVGRAGRALEQAYGILFNGCEDEEISNYFIETASPHQAHTEEVLKALSQATEGLSVPQMEGKLNLSRGQIEKVLKILALEFPSPITKQGSKWFATAINYQTDRKKIAQLKEIRYQEQGQMREYMNSQSCLMAFLAQALDEPNPVPCGKCAPCLKKIPIQPTYSLEKMNLAQEFLHRSYPILEPRKQWPPQAFPIYKFSGNIPPHLQAETGKALCLWGDEGWGELVKLGKYKNNYFDQKLVAAAAEMLKTWNNSPTWLTCVPSWHRSELVANFAQRLADELGIAFIPVVKKIRDNQPQKQMKNSYQQAHNLDGVFTIEGAQVLKNPVFLIDDFVDSRWTFTVITALLRQAGSGEVFPLALAFNSLHL